MAEPLSGMDIIRMGAEVASLTLERHWAITWLKIDQNRIAIMRSDRARRIAVDHLFRNTEEVIDHIWKQLA